MVFRYPTVVVQVMLLTNIRSVGLAILLLKRQLTVIGSNCDDLFDVRTFHFLWILFAAASLKDAEKT